MAMASASEKSWAVANSGRSTALLVELRQRNYVLPWALFLYAEGTDASVRAVFHTHVVTIEGAGLTSLLSDLAQQSVVQIKEPDRTAKFSEPAGPHIRSVTIEENQR
jgi:hypothetical protein